jgi:hypothetical protein
MEKHLFTFLFILSSWILSAQVPVGQWRAHFPYRNMPHVVNAGNLVYAASNYGLVKYDKEDNSLEQLTKINALSDVGITALDYNEQTRTLVIGYQNGNVDLIFNNRTINMSEIRVSNIIGSKRINHIFMYEEFAYLSCGFGIVVLNLADREVADTYIIGPNATNVNVLGVLHYNNMILALTDDDIIQASLDAPILADFSNWSSFGVLPPKQPQSEFSSLHQFQGKLFITIKNPGFKDDEMYLFDSEQWQKQEWIGEDDIYGINFYENKMVISLSGHTALLDASFNEEKRVFEYKGVPAQPSKAFYDGEFFWIGDRNSGFIKARDSWSLEILTPPGPYSSNCFRMDSHGGVLMVASGGVTSGLWGNAWSTRGAFTFENETWGYMNQNNQAIESPTVDILSVHIDRNDATKRYFGSWYNGFYESENNKITSYITPENSPMNCEGTVEGTCRVSNLWLDDNQNLWVMMGSSNIPVNVRTSQGEWYEFKLPGVDNTKVIGSYEIDNSGNKWFGILQSGIVVFNENGTLGDKDDDQAKVINMSVGQGNLPNLAVHAIKKDRNGALWVGTNEGVVVFYNPENIFSDNPSDAQQILVPQDEFVRPLLEANVVKAIAIDGANRKWFGTETSGVFLMSADGLQQIHHFTEQNSPLLSNNIFDINIDAITGEVFFATDKGLISYRGEATAPSLNVTEPRIFPNPVRPDFEGLIAIDRLANDSDVSITDIAGNIVHKTKSFGGRATWDGRNIRGEKVATGVYLVFASDRQGNQTTVGKIMFIN